MLVIPSFGTYRSSMSNSGMTNTHAGVERAVRGCAEVAVTVALALIDRGAMLDDLVAVFDYMSETPALAVVTEMELLGDVPELAVVMALSRAHAPRGHLPWVAQFSRGVAWGAFQVGPRTVVEA